MKKIMVYALCFVVAWTATVPSFASAPEDTGLQNKYDLYAVQKNARVIHVSAEEYPALMSRLSENGYHQSGGPILLASQYGAIARDTQILDVERDTSDECNEDSRPASSGDSSANVFINIMDDMTADGDGAGEVVVFVVIGAVVVVVWTLYVFKFLYDVTSGEQLCGRWAEWAFTTSAISAKSNQQAGFTGVHYLTGYRDGYTDIGLGVEAGYSDIQLAEMETLKMKGLYWLIGPALRWRMDDSNNPDLYEMEFLAGSTEHEDVGLLAKAKAGLSFGVGSKLRFGLNIGVLNINLNDTQTIITDRHRYYYLLGVEMGYRF